MADELPAVGHPVEIALCPVPAHVGANGPPKRSAPIHAIRKHQAGNNGIANPNSLFSAVAEVAQAEKESDHRGCGTKADAFCQGEQGVAPREHFLAETHEGEDGDPIKRPEQRWHARKCRGSELARAEKHEESHQKGNPGEPSGGSRCQIPEGISGRQPIRTQFTAIHAGHNPRGSHRGNRLNQFQGQKSQV
jgi:hypothetical protein